MLAALASWLDARAQGGQWLLRIEDVDSERCKPEHAATIRAQLQALGLAWDAELPAQSQRLNRYAEQLESWLSSDRVYACRCNRRALAPYRGAGRPEAIYLIERALEAAAVELGIDAMEIRRRNMIAPEQMPYKTPLGPNYDCGEFRANMDRALELADHTGFPARNSPQS